MDFSKCFELFAVLTLGLLSWTVETRPTANPPEFRIARSLVEKNDTTIHADDLRGFETKVYRNSTEMCKHPGNEREPACRRLCKWGYKISYDSKRVPRTLVVASLGTENHECGSERFPEFECTPLIRVVFVLRQVGECSSEKGENNNTCVYKPSFEAVPVGAGCQKKVSAN